jgi:hypothetical protein
MLCWVVPTAMHAVADVHDTPVRSLEIAAAVFGVRWIDQRLPSQRNARVISRVPELFSKRPTAVQAIGDVHATALRALSDEPVGVGVGWIAQPDAAAARTLVKHSASVPHPSKHRNRERDRQTATDPITSNLGPPQRALAPHNGTPSGYYSMAHLQHILRALLQRLH